MRLHRTLRAALGAGCLLLGSGGCGGRPATVPAVAAPAGPAAAARCEAPRGGHCVAVVTVDAAVPAAAAPPAAAATAPAADARSLIEHDLVSGGDFTALAAAAFPGHPQWAQPIPFADWRERGVDVLVLVGAVDPAAAVLRVMVLDTLHETVLLANDLPLPPSGSKLVQAHQAADLVEQRVTGVRGVADTAIAYISVAMAGGAPLYRLEVSEADGENARVLAESRQPLMSPAWSPDGTRLAYVGYEGDRSAIYLRNLATGAVTRLVSERGINGAPAWSPDGAHLAVTLSFGHNPDIYIIDVASGARRRITSDAAIETEATWSPDGRSIAFTSDRGGPARVYLMNADGSGVRQLAPIGKQTSNPCFSPDGKTLAVVVDQGRDSRIGLLHLDSGAFEMLSAGPRDEKPSFAPNGTMLVYSAEDERRGQLKVRWLDGRLRELHADQDVREPAWSPYLN